NETCFRAESSGARAWLSTYRGFREYIFSLPPLWGRIGVGGDCRLTIPPASQPSPIEGEGVLSTTCSCCVTCVDPNGAVYGDGGPEVPLRALRAPLMGATAVSASRSDCGISMPRLAALAGEDGSASA